MSYDQVWDKYYQRSTLERNTRKQKKSNTRTQHNDEDEDEDDYDEYDDGWTEQDIVAQTCMKILESSCRTNPLIDQLTLRKRGRRKQNNKRNGKRRRMISSRKIHIHMNESDDEEECDLLEDEEERENLEKIALTLE